MCNSLVVETLLKLVQDLDAHFLLSEIISTQTVPTTGTTKREGVPQKIIQTPGAPVLNEKELDYASCDGIVDIYKAPFQKVYRAKRRMPLNARIQAHKVSEISVYMFRMEPRF